MPIPITMVFTELQERQFPIESPGQRFTLRSASDFAGQLSLHANHLNCAIRQTTGQTTAEHIAGIAEIDQLAYFGDWLLSWF